MQVMNELEIDFPEGFLDLSKEEIAGLKMTEGGEGAAWSNREKHLLVTIGWKKIGGFVGMVLNNRDLKIKMERDIRKSLAHLDYREAGSSVMEAGGLTAEGFRYQYRAENGTQMTAESYVLKKGHTLYYFHLYSRTELASENSELIREVLKNAHWR